jgi:hypothetical protein
MKFHDNDLITRLYEVNNICSVYYVDCTKVWITNLPFVLNLIKDRDIFEIGPGRSGGLANILLENGAKSYVGVDIDWLAVEHSKIIAPKANFILEDPLYVLNHLKSFYLDEPNKHLLFVSSGVIDNDVLFSDSYISKLIKSISKATPIDGYNIHSANMLRKYFNIYFEKTGLVPQNIGWTDSFEVYKRIK